MHGQQNIKIRDIQLCYWLHTHLSVLSVKVWS